MAGYHGYAMSNNAVQAYEDGEKPLSKWTKKTLADELADALDVDAEEVEKVLKPYTLKEIKEKCLVYAGWHHTSSHYNRTAFYALDDFENLADLECRLSGKENTAKEERDKERLEALRKTEALLEGKYKGKMPTDKDAVQAILRHVELSRWGAPKVEARDCYLWLLKGVFGADDTLAAFQDLLSRSAEIDALNWVPFDADLFNRIAGQA